MAEKKTADNLNVVEELVRRFHAGAFDSAFQLYHPEVRIEQPSSLPHGGTFVGHDGVRAMGATFAKYWTRTITAPHRTACEDGGVVQLTSQTWTATSTGQQATVDVLELFTVESGLITQIRVFQHDTQRLLATLGDERSQNLPAWPRFEHLTLVDEETVKRLLRHWSEGWNSENLDCILAPFATDALFSSPFVSRLPGKSGNATVIGRDALRSHLQRVLQHATPGIRYTVNEHHVGTDSLALCYTVHHPKLGDRTGVDTMRVNAAGEVIEWRCHYPFAE